MGRPPLTGTILNALLRHMADGRWPAATPLPCSLTLAAELGVSQPTVLKALREARRHGLIAARPGRSDVVTERASQAARRILTRQTHRSDDGLIAMLIPDRYCPLLHHRLYRIISQAVSRECRSHGFRTAVVPWPQERQLEVVNLLTNRNCIAAIAIGLRPTYVSGISLLARRGFPTVLFHRRFPGVQLPTVRHDNYRATKVLAAHLVELGHRNMCLVTARSESERNRYGFPVALDGWWDYLSENGLMSECVMPIYVTPPEQFDPCGQVFQWLLSQQRRPTALVFEEGQWATKFLRDPRFAHLRLPEDLSVATFGPEGDRIPSAQRPPLSIVEIDVRRVAECLFETVARILGGETDPPSIRVPLRFELTDSIGPPPSGAPSGRKRSRSATAV